MSVRVDLHVHSKYSDRPSEWLLRRIGAPESFMPPVEVYRRARAAGMDFVTISDHNSIRGALEIAHLPGAFVSNEVTTYFPEDGCKLHLLVFGIDEAQFATIEELRPNVYELRDYLHLAGIPSSVAHPFFRVNGRLSPQHVEKLLLLFNRFECQNGARDRRANELARAVIGNLTPEWIERARERHGIATIGDAPWRKSFTAGSDDHGGLYVASAFTITPPAANVAELLEHLRGGRHEMGGCAGSSLKLARSFYEIAYQYYRSRFLGGGFGRDLLSQLFEGLIGTAPRRGVSVGGKLRAAWSHAIGKGGGGGSEVERRLCADLAAMMAGEQQRRAAPAVGEAADERVIFERASRLAGLLGAGFVRQLARHGREGRLVEALQSVASLTPVALGIAPYLAAFSTQHKDEPFLRQVARHFPWASGREHRGSRRVWFTDTLGEVNGVARTIAALGEQARLAQLPLTVVSCADGAPAAPWVVHFAPVDSFSLQEYQHQKVALPPFLEVIDWLEHQDVCEVILSTPGPLGLTGLLAARLLGLRTTGIYHTDFPAYVQRFTDNVELEQLARSFLCWFYDQLDLVYAPSESYRGQLIELGFAPEKLRTLGRGVDCERFDPRYRSERYWRPAGMTPGALRLLYVGRLSAEKNLDFLLDEVALLGARSDVAVFLVGDGPYRDALERRAARLRVPALLPGVLGGEELATAYASADLFVFPSTTETFGNVVLEAQASGLPVLVSPRGGPRELVMPGATGLVLPIESGVWARAIDQLAGDRHRLLLMGQLARRQACRFGWDQVLRGLWRGEDAGHAPIEREDRQLEELELRYG